MTWSASTLKRSRRTSIVLCKMCKLIRNQGDTVLIVKRQQPDLLKFSEKNREAFSDVVAFNQAAPSVPRQFPAVKL